MRLTKADGYKKNGGLCYFCHTYLLGMVFYFSLYKKSSDKNIIFFVFLTVVAILISALSLLKINMYVCFFDNRNRD